jgi:GMP synthase (glutamine-hydrolysing)
MKLGILRTDTVRPDWAAEYGEYPDMFVDLLGRLDPSLGFVVYHVEAGEYPADIDEVDAYLITGSKRSVYDDEPWIHRLEEFVRELHARRKKLVGICFGHQMVAQALGGETRKSEKGWGVGLHHYRFSERPDWFDGGDPDFRVLVSHQDQVVKAAPGTRVLAGSDFCENAVCQIGDHILTFQGHPEFVPGYARAIMNSRRSIIGEATWREGTASLAEAPESGRIGRWILAFLRR